MKTSIEPKCWFMIVWYKIFHRWIIFFFELLLSLFSLSSSLFSFPFELLFDFDIFLSIGVFTHPNTCAYSLCFSSMFMSNFLHNYLLIFFIFAFSFNFTFSSLLSLFTIHSFNSGRLFVESSCFNCDSFSIIEVSEMLINWLWFESVF